MAALPQGWTYVTFDPDSTTNDCPGGYGTPISVEQAPMPDSDTCTCTCTGGPKNNANPCLQGTQNVTFGYKAPVGGALVCMGPNTETISLTIDGNCDAIGAMDKTIGKDGFGNVFVSGQMSPLLPVQVACNVTQPEPPPLTVGFTCTPSSTGGSCQNGGTCLPGGVAPDQQCIQMNSDVACPANTPWVIKYDVYPLSQVTDDRMCNGCACNSAATSCMGAMLTTYANNNCMGGNGTLLTADANCDALTGNNDDSMDDHFIYTAQPNTDACAAASATVPVANPLQLPNPTSICCQQ